MLKRLLSSLSLRTIVMLFCLPFVILVVLSCVIFYEIGTKQVFNLISNNSESIVQQTTDSINNNLEQIYYLPSSLTTSYYFYKMRQNISEDNKPFEQQDYRRFSNIMETFLYQNSLYLDSITLYLSDGSIVFHRSNSSEMLRTIDFDFKQYSSLYKPHTLNWVNSPKFYPYSTFTSRIPAAGLIELFGTPDSHIQGFFFIGISDDAFISQIKNCRITENSCVTITKNGIPLYEDPNIVGASTIENLSINDKEIISEKINSLGSKKIISFNLSNNHILYLPLSLEGMGVLAVIPKDEMLLDYNQFSKVLTILGGVMIAICIVLYFLISPLISRPIVVLLKKLSLISKDHLDVPLEVDGSKEIVLISSGINNLLTRINLLIKTLSIEMQEKQNAELKALYAQINPHFLYNTLDSIQQLCDLNETAKAGKMVNELAIFYRIGVSKGVNMISLKEELTHIIMYLSILKTRFEDFQYEVNIPEQLQDSSIIKLILQPLVENALQHGIRPYGIDGNIFITAEKNNNDLYIYVKDDGGGISENILDEIKVSLKDKSEQKIQQPNQIYGLKNVHTRLQLTYGKDYGLDIMSVLDEGTVVTVKLPYKPINLEEI